MKIDMEDNKELYIATCVGEDLQPIRTKEGIFFDLCTYRMPMQGDLVQIDDVAYEIVKFAYENDSRGESRPMPVMRRYRSEQRQLIDIERRKELLSGFGDRESVETAEWLFDHDETPKDLYVDAYYLMGCDLPETEIVAGLKMVDGVHVDLSADLHILHKFRVRARSLRYAWRHNGFRKGYDVQYIFESDIESAATHPKGIFDGGKDCMMFILPTGQGLWHMTYIPYAGQTEWSGTSIHVFIRGRHPFVIIDEPKDGFDTMLKRVITGSEPLIANYKI